MIFVDTNILYHIIHKTPRTDEALTILEENPGDYIIDTVAHNEIIYASTMRYLEHRFGMKGAYTARKWIKNHGYPREVIDAVRKLIKRLNIRLVPSMYLEEELYKALTEFRLLPSDAIIALTCKHYGIDTILTFDEDFKRYAWNNAKDSAPDILHRIIAHSGRNNGSTLENHGMDKFIALVCKRWRGLIPTTNAIAMKIMPHNPSMVPVASKLSIVLFFLKPRTKYRCIDM